MKLVQLVAGLLLMIGLAACDQSSEQRPPPPPETDISEATGHYCGMLLTTHDGPKGQIHLASRERPIWHTSVRDTVAFTRLPEEPKDILAIYVNDMGSSQSWAQPGPETWIEAREAWFVIEAAVVGGMGLPEAVPFGTQGGAEAFVAEHGGRIMRFDEIPDDYVLGMTGFDEMSQDHGHSGMVGEPAVGDAAADGRDRHDGADGHD